MESSCRIKKCCYCLKESVRYFCTFCEVNLCKECKLRHLTKSAKTNKGHNVIYYRNKDSGIVHRRPCGIHKNEPSTGFCETCNNSVCNECEGHESHTILQISELLKRKINQILDVRQYLFNVLLPKIMERLKYFRSCDATLDHNHRLVEHKIYQYADKLHNVVNQWKVKMLSRSAEEKREYKNLIAPHLQETKEKHTAVKKRIEESRNILRDNYALHNPEFLPVNEVPEDTECLSEKPDLKIPKINLSTTDIDDQFLCNFADIPVTSSTSIIDNSNIHEVHVESKKFKNIQDMICSAKGDALFVTEKSMISKIDHEGKIQTEFKTNWEPWFTALLPGGLIYANLKAKTIEMIPFECPDKVRTIMYTEKWYPRGIAVTSSESILVCLRSYEEKRARVSIAKKNYLESFDDVKSIEWDEIKEPLYRDPRFIAENKNGDICVTDSAINSLIVVQKSGKLRFIYQKDISSHQFNPRNICTDSGGLLILLDISPISANIHVINHDGQFICHLATEQLCTPTAMCIDCFDRLWFANRENDRSKILRIERSDHIVKTMEEFKSGLQ